MFQIGVWNESQVRVSFRIAQRNCKAEAPQSSCLLGTIVDFCFVGSLAKNLC